MPDWGNPVDAGTRLVKSAQGAESLIARWSRSGGRRRLFRWLLRQWRWSSSPSFRLWDLKLKERAERVSPAQHLSSSGSKVLILVTKKQVQFDTIYARRDARTLSDHIEMTIKRMVKSRPP